MSNTHVESTRETFGGRAKGSCAGAVFGVFVLVGAVFLLAWNERRGAVRGRALDEGERVVAVASADRIDALLAKYVDRVRDEHHAKAPPLEKANG